MKEGIKNPFLSPVLMAVLGLILAGRVTAQIFTTLHSFTATSGYPGTNSDGAGPSAALVLSGGRLYGTARDGGSWGYGTVFALNTDGTGFTNLHSFTPFYGTNGDGAYPFAGLVLSGNTLYGTARSGGSSGNGTVLAVHTDGTGFTNLHNFTGYPSDGANPFAGLILSGNTLYGTAMNGGSSGPGTVFAIGTDGTGFTNLYSFSATGNGNTNSDGAVPQARLTVSSNILYGTTSTGGSSGNGTVFAVNTNGSGFTNLHSFTAALSTNSSGFYTNGDGAYPRAALVLSGNTLYGTASAGGTSDAGTIFAINTDGTGFTNLHSFTATSPFPYTNSDGAVPVAGLTLSGSTLYGTTRSGGSSSSGTVFAVNTDGTGFVTLHTFSAIPLNHINNDGAQPDAPLFLSGNTLYGTTSTGGSSGHGTVFSIFIQPKLTLVPSGANVVLTWPTNYTGLTLQCITNLVSPVWTTNSPAPVVVNGQNTVTNPISGTQQFFRLSQ